MTVITDYDEYMQRQPRWANLAHQPITLTLLKR